MTKTELITAIAQATGQKRTVAEQILNAGLQQISEALQRGEKVQGPTLRDFFDCGEIREAG